MLPADKSPSCPECENGPSFEPRLGRRDFIRVLGASAVAAALPVSPLSPLARARAARAEKQRAAEQLVFELYASMDADQKKKLVLPWNAMTGKYPSRLMTVNAPVGKSVIGLEYNKKQVELLDKTFRSIANGEEGYKELSRNGKFDNTGSFESAGALIYGEPVEGKKFSLVFASHHLTVRCDGNSEESTAFGGPLYYGHSPSGYAKTNVFYNQTKAANDIFALFTEDQKKAGVKAGTWKDEHGMAKPPEKDAKLPGLAYSSMSKDLQTAIKGLMKELVSPYRKEDGDEVMEIIKANGGFEKMYLGFYSDKDSENAKQSWSYWRLEGPGFVWSFRALPHIHTFVNVVCQC
jgi:hypothetical protein